MTRSLSAARETAQERRVWELLITNFAWRPDAESPVQVWGGPEALTSRSKFQLFELAVAAIFARMRPDYEWYVTPNRSDQGVDFLGETRFLDNDALGIAAGIRVGGQCKVTAQPDRVVGKLAGDLVNMAESFEPTFVVVALSSPARRKLIDEARERFERQFTRHCHILDRRQLEGLMRDHVDVVGDVVRQALGPKDARDVVAYFDASDAAMAIESVSVGEGMRVAAGRPFTITLRVRSASASSPSARWWWRPAAGRSGDAEAVTLVAPAAAGATAGASLASVGPTDDPLYAQHALELVTYSLGDVHLGELVIGRYEDGAAHPVEVVPLSRASVQDTTSPPFFEPPFKAGLASLSHEYDVAMATGMSTVAVVGQGGSGKSRLCEHFALEKRRRRGATVISANQPKSYTEPHRILADLFVGLVADGLSASDPATSVVSTLAQYDSCLAKRAAPAIRSIFGIRGSLGTAADQDLVAALVVLIAAHRRRGPVLVHLQDLHSASADVLTLIGRLVWQLQVVDLAGTSVPRAETGVLFIFEGRVRERDQAAHDGWSSEAFEAFLQTLDCTTVRCSAFSPDHSYEFIRSLFEARGSNRRLVAEDLLELQRQLMERIDRSAGGNPFHTLEQIRLLTLQRVIGRNRATGLFYLIQPDLTASRPPDKVSAAIERRWRYLRERAPALALLIWGAALLDDRLPAALFDRLWRELAPDVTRADIDATDMLWTGDADGDDVTFRHENYFRSIRGYQVPALDRERVVAIYADWFGATPRRGPADRFRWARVLLELPHPDIDAARRLMRSGLNGARRSGDARLARRISAELLDLAWTEDARAPVSTRTFLRYCDEDVALTRDLVASDRTRAANRLDRLRERLRHRLASGGIAARSRYELGLRRLTVDLIWAQILFNDRRPRRAAELAVAAIDDIRALMTGASSDDERPHALEVEALDTQAVALALDGEIDAALDVSLEAVELARATGSLLWRSVASTRANILLARDPAASEALLRELLAGLDGVAAERSTRNATEVNLSMALLLRAYESERDSAAVAALLDEASERLRRVSETSFDVGRYADAAAAALLLGIISALRGSGDEASWFGQAVAAAARGRQMETLWRAHINLATALHRRPGGDRQSVRDHALAALELMDETLAGYSRPDRSARFRLLSVPMAHAVRQLIEVGDDAGPAALERYPALRDIFEDVDCGVLRGDRGGYRSHEWLRLGDHDFVIY